MKQMTNRTPLRVTFKFEIEPAQWEAGDKSITQTVSMSGLVAERMLDVPDSLASKLAQMAVVELANIADTPAEEVEPDVS